MRRVRMAVVAALAVLSMGSCQPSIESAMADATDGLKTLNGILDGVRDVDSARSACAQLDKHAGIMEAAARIMFEAAKSNENMSPEKMVATVMPFIAEQTKVHGHVTRLEGDDEVWSVIESPLSRCMQATPAGTPR